MMAPWADRRTRAGGLDAVDVERGQIVLAAFGHGGKLLPAFPTRPPDDTKPRRTAERSKRRAWLARRGRPTAAPTT